MKRWRNIRGGIILQIVEQDDKPGVPGIWDLANPGDGPGDEVSSQGAVTKPKTWRITPEAFWGRWSFGERTDLDVASQHNPAANNATQKAAAKFRLRTADINNMVTVNLKSNKADNLVRDAEAAGVLAAGRGDVILLTPAADSELPAA